VITLIKNVRAYQNGTWKEGEILIAGDKIEAMARKIDCTFPGMQVIDAEGMRCIPGYLDQHVHITGGGGEGGFANQVPPLPLSAPVRAGVTTLVGPARHGWHNAQRGKPRRACKGVQRTRPYSVLPYGRI